MKLVKTITSLAVVAFLSAPLIGADNEANVETDKSTNPITGTETTKRTAKFKRTRKDGTVDEAKQKDKVKVEKDGDVTATSDTKESVDKNNE